MDHIEFPRGSDTPEFDRIADAVTLNGEEIVSMDDRLRLFLGYETHELAGRSILDLLADESRIELRERIRQRHAGPFSVHFRCKDGRIFRAIGEGLLRDASGRDLSVVAIRSLQRQLEQAEPLEILHARIDLLRQAVLQKEAALQVLLHEINNQRQAINDEVRRNIERVALPVVRRLRAQSDDETRLLLQRLEETLDEIAAPFISALERQMTGLSPREVEICHMIKNGYSTKEIAAVLTISPQTVSVHRKIIRRKLGLTGREANLISFLRSLEIDR